MDSSNSDGDRNLLPQDNEVDIPVVEEVVAAFETGEHTPNHPPVTPV